MLIAIGLFFAACGAARSPSPGSWSRVTGLVVGVFGTVEMGSILHPIGLGLYGLGFAMLGLALRRHGTRKLGVATLVIATPALLGAIDHGIIMIPYISVSPALLRLLTELVWVGSTASRRSRSQRQPLEV